MPGSRIWWSDGKHQVWFLLLQSIYKIQDINHHDQCAYCLGMCTRMGVEGDTTMLRPTLEGGGKPISAEWAPSEEDKNQAS